MALKRPVAPIRLSDQAVGNKCRGDGFKRALTEKQARQLETRVGHEGILRVRVAPGLPKRYLEVAALLRPLLSDERRYTLEVLRFAQSSAGYEVVVRRFGGRWVITECLPIWVS